jgi:DNA polymerase-3 subunit delta'
MNIWNNISENNKGIDFLKNLTKIPNALLISGNPVFKKELAVLDFAAKLQCSKDGCGICKDCINVLKGIHPNVINFPVNSKIEEFRNVLIPAAEIAPQNNKYKVIILDNVDKMRERISDTLLKAIEEPTVKTIWILTTNVLSEIIPTIRSRCLIVNLGYKNVNIPVDPIKKNLRKQIFDNMFLINSTGSAVVFADKFYLNVFNDANEKYENTILKKNDEFSNLTGENIKKKVKGNDSNKKSKINEMIKNKLNLSIDYIFSFWNDVLIYKHTGNNQKIINIDYVQKIMQKANNTDFNVLHSIIQKLLNAKKMLTTNVSLIAQFEYLFIHI